MLKLRESSPNFLDAHKKDSYFYNNLNLCPQPHPLPSTHYKLQIKELFIRIWQADKRIILNNKFCRKINHN